MSEQPIASVQIGCLLENSFARKLPKLCRSWMPQAAPHPTGLLFNHALATQLGLDTQTLAGAKGLAIFAGQALPQGSQPVAQTYAGHQFGGFSPQLGDGRALLLGEIVTPSNQRFDMALKGSGRTPFARGGDGKAAVGPMLREYLISEAMHALGIPTTRTLAVVATGESVRRDRPLPGAIMCRIASSHLRVGTFEYAACHHDTETLRALVQYTISRHYPHLIDRDNPALALLEAVIDRQAKLIARWMGVGFIHGVMNTDNMTLSGETIDYGPCAFMEAHDPQAVFSSIDHRGRYAYGHQPHVGQWNLARFAETLLPLIDSNPDQAIELASQAVQGFQQIHEDEWLKELRAKLGLTPCAQDSDDLTLAHDYLGLLHAHRIDHTLGFRSLSGVLSGNGDDLRQLFGHATAPLQEWLNRWTQRLRLEPQTQQTIALQMNAHNPLVIPRNHRVEEALQAASDNGDMSPLTTLLEAITHPYQPPTHSADMQAASLDYTRNYQTFCGT